MKHSLRLLSIIIGFAINTHAMALKSDRDQPANIEADDIEFNLKKGTRTYTRNVLAVQGTLRLKADKLHAIYTHGELSNATAWGSLARFKQRPDGKLDDVEGWGKKIIVDQKANTLTLIGKAALKQGPQTARGDTIVYNMATDTLSIKGGAKLQDGNDNSLKKAKDSFADNQQGPANAAPSATEATRAANTNTKEAIQVPASSGRSRLIIQPGSVKKKN